MGADGADGADDGTADDVADVAGGPVGDEVGSRQVSKAPEVVEGSDRSA